MRTAPIIALTGAAVILSACGSSSTAPVESASSDAGAVAGNVADCPEGPPARSPLSFGKIGQDGVVGGLYNDTGQPIYVTNGTETPTDNIETPCRLGPGKATFYSGSNLGGNDIELYLSAEDNSFNRAGTRVNMSDGIAFWPQVWVEGFSFRHPGWSREWNCTPDESKRINISQGQSQSYDNYELGKLTVARLNDDGAAAREYVGTDSSKVNDWARIDVRISRLGGCS